MQRISAHIASVPFIQSIAKKTRLAPEYIALALAGISFVVIQKTPIGAFFSNFIVCMVIMRGILGSLRSPAPKPAEMRKHVIVLTFFAMFVLLENLGINTVVPLFGLIKLATLIWTGSNAANADSVYETLLSKIPLEYLQAGDDIETAVKKAAKAVDEKIDLRKGK